MATLNTKIFNHDNDVDITHKINSMELYNWIDHLKYIKKEVVNLMSICSKDLNNEFVYDTLAERFHKKEIENDTLLNALQKYLNSRTSIVECEDTECDMIYISKHESYRRSYMYHLDKYRRLKDDFFNKAQWQFMLLSDD